MKKKFASIVVSFLAACFCLTAWLPEPAGAAFLEDYVEQYMKDTTDPAAVYAVVLTLEDRPLSEYEAARRLGTGTFVQTAEGQERYRALIEKQDALLTELETVLARSVTAAYRYTAALNGICIYLSQPESERVLEHAASLGYDGMYLASAAFTPESRRSDLPAASGSEPRADASGSALEYVGNDGTYGDGTGTVVAVIDTELDFRHEYFTMKEPGTGRLTKAYVDGISPYLSTASFQRDSYYVSEKLPYVANYENYTANTYCDAQDIVHGSHVSGIAAGNGAGASGSRYQISGNAPNAQLVFMGNAHLRDETLFASFDDCLYLEVDVVNCSFGAEGVMLYGKTDALEFERKIVENLVEAGIQVCAAAGNSDKYALGGNALLSHPAYSIPGYPYNIPQTLTIASAQNPFSIQTALEAADGSLFVGLINSGFDSEELEGLSAEYAVIPGIGSAADFEGIDVSGKYALVRRGEISFEDKSKNAADAGAAGIIFYNNIEGESLSAAAGSVLPGLMVSLEDGEAMAALEEKTVRFRTFYSQQEGEPEVSAFTSWNCSNLLTLKPDLLCFGGNIYSSVPDNAYEFFNGTSMATPQAAGLYAILKQNVMQQKTKYGIEGQSDYPGIISKLLMSTAHPVSDSTSRTVISPRRQGNGVPNVKDALETPAYIYTESAADEYRPKLSLGDDAKRTGKFSFAFFVKNVSDTEVTYTLSYDLISDAVVGDATEDRSDDALAGYARNLSGNVSFRDSDGMEIKTVTVPAGAEARVEAFVSLSKADMDYMDRYFENGTYAEGYIYLKNNENPDLLLSFMGFYGSWLGSPVFDAFLYDGGEAFFEPTYLYADGGLILGMNLMDLFAGEETPAVTVPYFSPDGNGVLDSFSVSTTLLRPVYDLTLKIYNEDGELVYEQFAGDSGSWAADRNAPLSQVKLDWDGKDTDGLVHSGKTYRMEYTCRVLPDGSAWTHAQLQIVIDTENPEVRTVFRGETADGTELLYVNAEDQGEIQGALLISPDGELYSLNSASSSGNGGACIALTAPEDPSGYLVEIYDYAGNCTVIPVEAAAPFLCGDTTGDGTVDGKDAALLLQYLAERDVPLNVLAADADADGAVTGKDAALLLQYLAEWDVVLGTD